ncbi:MAG: futalosine hydrolase [Phycisphaerales bacterium]
MVAAASEARAVLAGAGFSGDVPKAWGFVRASDEIDLLLCGVGKANASGATAQAIAHRAPSRVLNLGICGALPHAQPLQIGQAILASRCLFADEGIETTNDWIPLAKAGFPAAIDADSITPSESFNRLLRPLADRVGVVTTVSSCSGTDARAEEIASRSAPDGLAEAMEGAAIGLAAARANIPFAELRVVSNRTGDRESQGWNLPLALARLERIAAELAAILSRSSAG